MAVTVGIAGATGYAGAEVVRLLLNHPAYNSGELIIGPLMGNSNAGGRVGALLPHMSPLADHVIEPTDAEHLHQCDVVFLGLPHGDSAEVAREVEGDCLILDLSADFRLKDAAQWEKFYHSAHAGTFTYGLPELPGQREKLTQSRTIAVPGCFPTGAALAATPALAKDVIEPELTIVSFSGVSGAGKKASVANLGAETMNSARAYNVGGIHRHTPEMEQNFSHVAGEPVNVSFTPVLAPMTRGILTTTVGPLKDEKMSSHDLNALYTQWYTDEEFVVVLPEGQQPATQNVCGSNYCHIQVTADPHAGKAVITSAIDNLTKGTAGNAIQSMNLALGWPEHSGLTHVAVAP